MTANRRASGLQSAACALACVAALAPAPLSAQTAQPAQPAPGAFLPLGGGYSDLYGGFAAAAVANARGDRVEIVVLPMSYSTDAATISDAERETNLRDAEERRFQIEEACRRAAAADVTCRATLAPIFTRTDAADADLLAALPTEPAALFFLGGDQTVAMEVLADTPLEESLAAAHGAGALVAGTSAGAAVQSVVMLGGYNPNFADGASLHDGAVDLWDDAMGAGARRGLAFGLEGLITDQHFFQRGRLGRLINAVTLSGAPPLGLGVDAYTGAVVRDGIVGDLFGLYVAAVVDAATYGAAESRRVVEIDGGGAGVLSVRNLLVHLLAPGGSSYDLAARAHALAPPPATVARDFNGLRTPAGAGALILGGDISKSLADSPALAALRAAIGEDGAGRVLVIGAGYPAARTARSAAERYARALGAPCTLATLVAGDAPLGVPADTAAMVVVARDASLLDAAQFDAVRAAWLEGVPLLLDNAAVGLAGPLFSAHGPTPDDDEAQEAAKQKSLLVGRTRLEPGLGLIEATVEPQLLGDNRWGRLFSLAWGEPAQPALGLSRDGALLLDAAGATVLGAAPMVVLDLRAATLDTGANDAFVIANGLIDVFAPGETVVGVEAVRAE